MLIKHLNRFNSLKIHRAKKDLVFKKCCSNIIYTCIDEINPLSLMKIDKYKIVNS